MLDIQFVRDNPERVREGMRAKKAGDIALVDELLAIDEQRREAVTRLQDARTELNAASKQIGTLMGAGKREDAQDVIARSNDLKQQVKELEEEPRRLDERRRAILLEIPNVPHPSVPVGHSPEDNEVVFEHGEMPRFDFDPLPHWEITEQHGLVDFERGAKVTGAGFPFYLGAGARLQRALIQFFLDRAVGRGYVEIQPPLLVNEQSGIGTGQLPDKEDLMYEVSRDDLFLIPTSEVSITNFFRDEILEEDALPTRFAAYTPCFRREAGSYGKEVRGLNRLHQFDKVELVMFVRPEESEAALEALRDDAEALVQALGLPYRRLLMCTGDMGFTQSKKYDLEVWSPGQQRWLEVSSISNFEAYQARRANIRYRRADGARPRFVHTLNGSGLALPRIVAALLEQYQQEDGRVRLPEVLHPYTGFEEIG